MIPRYHGDGSRGTLIGPGADGIVIRRIFIILSVATASVGIWLITRTHELDVVCNADSSSYTGAGVSVNCMNIVSSYFLGFALAVGGMIVFLLSVLAMAKHDSAYNWHEQQTVIPHRSHHDIVVPPEQSHHGSVGNRDPRATGGT